MPTAPRESFIPRKSTAPSRSRQAKKAALGVFGYISYITFIGAIILTAGMLFISMQISDTLAEREQELAAVKDAFQQSDMEQVQEYETYMNVVENTFNESFSVAELFTSLENSIIESAVISSVQLEQDMLATDRELVLSGEVITDSFDAALFQRNLYQEFPLLERFVLNDVVLLDSGQDIPSSLTNEDEDGALSQAALNEIAQAGEDGSGVVTFTFNMTVDPDDLSFAPQSAPADIENTTVPPTATSSAGTADSDEDAEAVSENATSSPDTDATPEAGDPPTASESPNNDPQQ